MNLPRPLLVVLLIVLLLGVVGCVVSVARLPEQRQSDADKESEVRGGGVSAILSRLAPPSAPVQLEVANAPCFNPATGRLQFAGGCLISIPATGDLRRQLKLVVSSGQLFMQVTVVSDGTPRPSDTELITIATDDASIVLARGDLASVTLQCISASCNVVVNP